MVQHIVRLGHIPYGFFEKQIHGYFSQFGDVKRVRLLRSKKGHHNGIGFVEFGDSEVAKIAAQTMDNYLLAEKRIRCKVLGEKEVPKCIQKGRLFVKTPKIGENQIKHAKKHFRLQTSEQEKRQRYKLANDLRKRMLKLKAMGIIYEFEFEEKLNKILEEDEERKKEEEVKDEEEKEELKEEEEEHKTAEKGEIRKKEKGRR